MMLPLGWVMFLFAVVWSLRTAGSQDAATGPDWKWWLLTAGVLLCFRWPLFWLPHELYPDESQLIAGAITLRYDPVFWRSVDGGTAGPLDYYPLLPAAFASGTTCYALTRLTAAAMIWGGLIAIGESLASVTSRGVARIAVLPLLAFEAFTTSAEFVHYSTELAPALLLAIAFYALARQAARPSVKNIWLAALLLGAVPFAKLQAGPIAGVLWLLLAGQEISAGRRSGLGPLFIGAALPLLAAVVLVTVTGQAENLLIPYLLHNLQYAQEGRESVVVVALQQWEQAAANGYLALWLAGSVVFLVMALALARNTPKALRRFQLAAALFLAAAIFCVLAPGRPYNHYLNLLMLPLSLVVGSTLASLVQPVSALPASRRLLLAGVFLVCCVAPQMALRASNRPDPFEYYNTTDRGPAYRELADTVRALTTPGEALGIWGWRSSLYVETGLRQATRQAHSEAQLLPGPWQNYFLRRYLEDFQSSNPPVFADAVGPGNFRFQNRKWAHEIFPALRAWVQAHYTQVADLDGTRLYVRNDRLAAGQRAVSAPARP